MGHLIGRVNLALAYASSARSVPADDASFTEQQHLEGDIVSSRLILDACYPYGHKVPLGEQNRNSKELREQTRKKWSHLFI